MDKIGLLQNEIIRLQVELDKEKAKRSSKKGYLQGDEWLVVEEIDSEEAKDNYCYVFFGAPSNTVCLNAYIDSIDSGSIYEIELECLKCSYSASKVKSRKVTAKEAIEIMEGNK